MTEKMQPVTQVPVIPSTRRRPPGITVFALIYFVYGAFAFILGLVFIAFGPMLSGIAAGLPPMLSAQVSILEVFLLVVGLVALVVGWGLWTGKGWAWWLTVIIETIETFDLLIGLVAIASGDLKSLNNLLISARGLIAPLILWYMGDLKSLNNLLISARGLIAPLILWYMFRPHVKIFFGR